MYIHASYRVFTSELQKDRCLTNDGNIDVKREKRVKKKIIPQALIGEIISGPAAIFYVAVKHYTRMHS